MYSASMPDNVLEDLETNIKNLQHDDIVGCMQSYDRLSRYAKGLYEHVTDSKIKNVLSRIMTSKQDLTKDLESLRTKTFEEKRECLRNLLLNSTSIQESDYLWSFFERGDIDSEEKMNSLGIRGDLYLEWKKKHKMKKKIREVDNFFAKCICRLDYFLKIFILGNTRYNDVTKNPNNQKYGDSIGLLLHQMKLLQ